MDIESALLDLYICRLRTVGRKHLTNYELWQRWLRED